jgi:hypothetical protein
MVQRYTSRQRSIPWGSGIRVSVHLHCAQQTTHISQDDRKSIIALCPRVVPIIRTYLLMLEHSDKNTQVVRNMFTSTDRHV